MLLLMLTTTCTANANTNVKFTSNFKRKRQTGTNAACFRLLGAIVVNYFTLLGGGMHC